MPYIPTRDAMDRHDYGVSKARKASSTGGGRAWSEDEEQYLLQTRLQKMPYKYIAAHLKKTELACRLHYHQLSHGSNRRKRATSCSSTGTNDYSPAVAPRAPSLARESVSRSVSPPGSSASYSPPPTNNANCIQLPSIVTSEEVPRLPAILPKPSSLALPPPTASQTYASPAADNHVHIPPPAPFHRDPHAHHRTTPPLRLDCSGLPPPPPTMPAHNAAHVDLSRLHSIYSAHRTSFWTAVAGEYGPNVSPTTLEQAWKTGMCCSQTTAVTPITPISSPSNTEREHSSSSTSSSHSKGQDKTRISSILGIDADPRTARDRDIVRRMEEERFGVMQPAH